MEIHTPVNRQQGSEYSHANLLGVFIFGKKPPDLGFDPAAAGFKAKQFQLDDLRQRLDAVKPL
jgi:hypothetical protein